MFSRIALGLVFMAIGGLMIYYSAKLAETFGRINWAEEYLGGTRQGFLAIGFVIVVIGGLVALGVVGFSDPTSTLSSSGE